MTDQPSGTPSAPSVPPLLKRPRGRQRYPDGVVVDAPVPASAAANELVDAAEATGTRGRLALSQNETAAVRPPAQLPPVTHTPATRSPAAQSSVPAAPDRRSGRRLVAGGRFEGPLSEGSLDDEQTVAEGRRRPQRQVGASHAAPSVRDRGASVPGSHAAPPGPSTRRARERPPAPRTGTVIMGVLNVTPDSFSDGGRHVEIDAAVAHARSLVAAGADIVDVGGESTRPGAGRVEPAEELRRVLPVVRQLASEGLRISIDTMNASTAAAAVEAGADIINDVSGGLADPDMARVAAESGRTFVAMHWRGRLGGASRAGSGAGSAGQGATPARGYDGDVVGTVADELAARVDDLVAHGVDPSALVLDPGLGFSKDVAENWQLLAHLEVLGRLGLPVLIGASRKRFLAGLVPDDAPPSDRDPATAVISALAAQAGAWGVRVHDVAGTRTALDVWQAWSEAAAPRRPARHA